jgi:hypothetical protein
MLKGTLFLLILLILILASSMIFGGYGALEGAVGKRGEHKTKCTGPDCIN